MPLQSDQRRFTSADFHAMMAGPTSQQSFLVRDLENSSGSDDDVGIVARKIMKERKKDRKRIEELGQS